MDDHRVQVNNNLNDNSGSDQGGREISRSLGPFSVPPSPEKLLVLFVIKLLILRGMSYGIRAMGVFWASTVLLPNLLNIGYGTDFYFIIIILSAEGARIFCLNYDFDWRLRSLWTISDAVKSSCRYLTTKVIRWLSATNPSCSNNGPTTSRMSSDHQEDPVLLLPDADDLSGHFLNKLIYCLQLLSALTCITLVVVRVILLSIGKPSSGDYRPAVYVFYALAFAQAFFSLLEEAYWEWTITYRRLLKVVNEKCDELGMTTIRSFFHHAYWECVKGKISDGSSLNLFSFASKLLMKSQYSRHEQLIGVEILHKFSTNYRSRDTLRDIGKSLPIMEKLLSMLSWNTSEDAEIKQKAAKIVLKLAGISRNNSFRLSGFHGALEYISSLVHPSSHNEMERDLAILGIKILRKLSHNPDNCKEIAHSEDLMHKLLNALSDPVLRHHSAKVLHNLCEFVGIDCFKKGRGVAYAAISVLEALMRSEENEKQIVNFATQLLRCMTPEEANLAVRRAGNPVPDVAIEGRPNLESGIAKLTRRLIEILQNERAIIHEPPLPGIEILYVQPDRTQRESEDSSCWGQWIPHACNPCIWGFGQPRAPPLETGLKVSPVRLDVEESNSDAMTRKRWDKVGGTTRLAIEMMAKVEHAIPTLRGHRMDVELHQILRNPDCQHIHDLVKVALDLLEGSRVDFPTWRCKSTEHRSRIVARTFSLPFHLSL